MTTVTMRRSYSTVTVTVISEIPSESILTTGPGPGISPPNKLSILTVVPLSVLALCMVAGFAGICILLKTWNQRKENCMANEVNQTYHEVIDPIYETIPSTESKTLTQDNFKITMMSNEAYASSEKVISMQNNSSYLSASQFMMHVDH